MGECKRVITLKERREARAAIRQLHAPGLRRLAHNPVFVRAVVDTVKAMEASHVDVNKVFTALERWQLNEGHTA